MFACCCAATFADVFTHAHTQAKKRAAFLKRHLGRTLELNEFEQLLAAQVCLCVCLCVRGWLGG